MTIEEVICLLLGQSATGTPWIPFDRRPQNDPVLERQLAAIAWAAEEGTLEDMIDAVAGLDELERIRQSVALQAMRS